MGSVGPWFGAAVAPHDSQAGWGGMIPIQTLGTETGPAQRPQVPMVVLLPGIT